MSITETPANVAVPVWTLGERLTKAREHAGISIDQMARQLGVSDRTIRNYENQAVRITRATLIAYSSETHVPIDWFDAEADPRSRCFLDDAFLQDGHEVHYPHLPLEFAVAA